MNIIITIIITASNIYCTLINARHCAKPFKYILPIKNTDCTCILSHTQYKKYLPIAGVEIHILFISIIVLTSFFEKVSAKDHSIV